jgi:hypothetical protein
MARDKIKFGRMESGGYREDPRTMSIFRGDKEIGEITAEVDNVGTYLSPEWRVVAYEVQLWDHPDETVIEVRKAVRRTVLAYVWEEVMPARRGLFLAKQAARKMAAELEA